MARFIFITGGVVSSLGKGLASAALGALLQARGYSVRLRKLDPYLNVDPGTMSPFEHGEVFVTDDGAETDLDLGHYERFTGVAARRTDSVSSGRIYSNVLEKERRGDYLGRTIQVIPHVTNEIKDFLRIGEDEVDFMLCEIGGTVGDIEGLPFFEAIRQFGQEQPRGTCIYMHLTLLPYMAASGELKTKPTQHSVKELRAIGIAPDVLVCRSEMPIPPKERDKLALFCNVRPDAVIAAQDLRSIYEAPLAYHEEGLDQAVLDAFMISPAPRPNLAKWEDVVDRIHNPEGEVRVAIVGKYTQLEDAYKSIAEALTHGGIANRVKVQRRVDRMPSASRRTRTSRRCSRIITPSWCRAASASAAPRARSARRVRPRAQGALPRHLPRDADGGGRGVAEPARASPTPAPRSSTTRRASGASPT